MPMTSTEAVPIKTSIPNWARRCVAFGVDSGGAPALRAPGPRLRGQGGGGDMGVPCLAFPFRRKR